MAQEPRITAGPIEVKGGTALVGDFRDARLVFHDRSSPEIDKAAQCCSNLFLTNPKDDRAALISKKGRIVEGTCSWVEENAIYRSWRDFDTQLLWICGAAGQGKTMLSIFLTEKLEEKKQTIYYFCSSDDQTRNSVAAVLRGLMWQVTAIYPGSAKQLLEDLDDPKKMKYALENPDALWRVFTKVVEDCHSEEIFCVLDGLDELDEISRDWLIAKLDSIARTSVQGKLKLLAVSRFMLGLEKLTRLSLDNLQMENSIQDIKIFIKAKVDDLATRVDFNATFRQKIETSLLERAESTFLWVGLAMSELLKCSTITQIQSSLDTLPKGLPGIYCRMLHQMITAFEHPPVSLLRWVAMAVMPLSFSELVAATNTRPLKDIDAEQVVRDQVKICSPLLQVRQEMVSLIHQSAKDYLSSEELKGDPLLGKFHLQDDECNLVLAQICLEQCETSELKDGMIDLRDHLNGRSNSFLRYAILHWHQHVRKSISLSGKLLDLPRPFFQEDSTLRANWKRSYMSQLSVGDPIPPDRLLDLSCFLGIYPWVESCLRETGHADHCISTLLGHQDEFGFTALYYAVREGHEQIVRLLLNHNAPLEVGNIADYSLLNQAVNFGDANLVELLLGKPVDARGPSGAVALRSAIRAKRKDISGLLLRHGADPNADDSIESQKPLRYAVDWQHDLEEIKLLLRFGAKQNERGFNGQIALHAAADFCDVEVAQLLLEHGAIVDCKDDDGLTPLHMACSGLTDSEGRVPVARLLLEYNANLGVTDNEFLTPLHYAATYPSRADMVRFLLDSKAFVDARDVNGRTPLHNAVTIDGNETTVNLLLQHGADATVQDLKGCRPKHHIAADNARRYRLYMKHRLSSSWPR